ncbi:MAG: DNA recombination protein RmuC [Mesorhizobium amorphae]|nr:MAG: DNA recombination protein RmuC [Mesorhizobium amorphae]
MDATTPLFRLGATTIGVAEAAMFLGALLLLAVIVSAFRGRRADRQLAELAQAHAALGGRLGAVADALGARQAELNRSIGQRLDAMTGRLGQSITEQTRVTHANLARLGERLAAIDTAQANIQDLAGQVVKLQATLADKQARGAFGQGRMEAIVADALPPGAFEFQGTLSNGSRPDCLIRMPNGQPSLAVDAKFPLEAWNRIRSAETLEARKIAAQGFKRDVDVHIRDIADKYLLAGETQDTAFLFVPSESVFADIHEHFPSLIQRAHRARVVIVGPSLLMLSIQVVQAILKDARMREQAHLIQVEVAKLGEELGRLDDRVRKLGLHWNQAGRDVEEILAASERLAKRGARIEAMDLAEPAPAPEERRPVRLRVVEEE